MGNKIRYPKPHTLQNLITRRLLAALTLIIGTGLLVIFTNLQSSGVLTKVSQNDSKLTTSPPKLHPLPPTLSQWQDITNSGDYFSQIATTPEGYLVWSKFPIRVYLELPKAVMDQEWVKSILQVVQEWSAYLPLTVVEQPEVADIVIVRKAPPLQISPDGKIYRARSAQTSYELYTSDNVLYHRFTILLSPSQTDQYLQAAARHELGHALGIWGHSQLQTDALYFSQVRNPPPISPRDVNTLKRVYEQSTSLGWTVGNISPLSNVKK
jgi:predicted Zn-dependent protease